MDKPYIIAVDGTTASGKGTLSFKLAQHLGFDYLDTGLLYRKVAAVALRSNASLQNENELEQCVQSIVDFDFSNIDLRSQAISETASKIAAVSAVRQALFDVQRNFPLGKKGAVVDGRDIGTVIFPEADIKFFITAGQEVRAMRRHKQISGAPAVNPNASISYDDVLNEIIRRDERDASREAAPMRPAKDAMVIDTSNLNANEVLNLCLKLTKLI
jgi:cytidylate kinase